MEWFVIAGIGIVVLFILFRLFKAFVKWTVILFIGCFVLAYFTKPDEIAIRDDLKQTVKEQRLKRIRGKAVQIEDYKFFSLVKVRMEDQTKAVGIAAFGKIWYFDRLEKKSKSK